MAITAADHGIAPARPRTGLRADPLGDRATLHRRDARSHQLCAGQPADHRPPDARGFRALLARARTAADVRRLAQHLQAGNARVNGDARLLYVHRKGATRALGPGHPGIPDCLSVDRPAGADRRQHGHRILGAGRHGQQRGDRVFLGLPRRRPQHEPQPGAQALAGAARSSTSSRRAASPCAARRSRGVAEEAPGAYKDVAEVVLASERAGLARRVARLQPVICIKG